MHSPGGSDHSEERAARMRQEIPDPTVKLLEGSVTHCKCLRCLLTHPEGVPLV